MLKTLQVKLIAAVAMLFFIAAPTVGFGQFPGADELQTWSDETLKHQIKAKFKGMEGDAVKLETADGQVRKIPYNKLSLSSQLKVKKITDPRLFDAPPLPSTYAAPPIPESPFTQDDSIEKFLDTLHQQLKDGHAEALWHALPPQGRADLEACIVRIADIAGPTTFKQMQVVLPDLQTIVRDKRTFIVNSQPIAAVPALAKSINQILPGIEPLLGVFTKSTTWNSENFKEGKVGPWLMLFAKELLTASDTVANNLRPLFPNTHFESVSDVANYKVLEKTADSATVEFAQGKVKHSVKFKKVDGYWIADWEEKMLEALAQGKVQLENVDQAQRDLIRTGLRTQLAVVNGVLGPLAKAKTQPEFSQYFDPYAPFLIKLLQDAIRQSQAQAGMQAGMQPGMQPGMQSGGEVNSGGEVRPRKSISDGLSGVGGSR